MYPSSDMIPRREANQPANPSELDPELTWEDVDFGQILHDFEAQNDIEIADGAVVEGTIIAIDGQQVFVDVGYKSEGIVQLSEFKGSERTNLVPGSQIAVQIRQIENRDGLMVLSHADVVRKQSWESLEAAHQSQAAVTGRIVGKMKGGFRVEINGIDAFLPASHASGSHVAPSKEVEFQVLKLVRNRGNVVLSRKAWLAKQNEANRNFALINLRDGFVVEGHVKKVVDYGVFVDLGGLDGLLHVSEIAWGRVENPSQHFAVGDPIQVKILKFDVDRQRISLGLKQLVPDPWATIEERYAVGMRVRGRVVSHTDFGSFVEVEPQLEALIYRSEMSWTNADKHPSVHLNIGQEVEAMVLKVDRTKRQLGLGIKQLTADPWEGLLERYSVGSKVSGEVRHMTVFGAFVEIEPGVEGLIHVSEITDSKRIKHPAEVLKRQMIVEAMVVGIDAANRRISLSRKALNSLLAWDRFFAEKQVGETVTGIVVRCSDFGAFVKLEDGVEALCHVSELTAEQIRKPEDVVQIGQTLPFKIIRLNRDAKQIGLSLRADAAVNVLPEPSHYAETQTMSSLGDLSFFQGSETEN